MKDYQEIIGRLRAQGHRVTKTRQGVLKLLSENRKPVAASETPKLLEREGIIVNKTTVYRELDFLFREGCIDEVRLNDGRRYYEMVSEHHHHAICIECKGVDDVVLESELAKEEKRIERELDFKILHHSLEFFGVCARCR